ncbi:hypothetical protein P5G61_17055 [Paenibacillus sp. F6_3S_P_1C]|uniref:Uncharacterized protein n=1 Tax=Paenibacillus vandeheii TaxID=3035917 RepID=A0ABT8JCW7_9BACL|nr:hypothetical protein [Paenibacillus vandeheii]
MEVVITDMGMGSWIALSKVDFGHEGAASFSVTMSNGGCEGGKPNISISQWSFEPNRV